MASKEIYCIVESAVESDPTRRQFFRSGASSIRSWPAWFMTCRCCPENGIPMQVRTPAGDQPGDRDQIEAVLGHGLPASWEIPRQGIARIRRCLWPGRSGVGRGRRHGFRRRVVRFRSLVEAAIACRNCSTKSGYSSLLFRVEDDGGREATADRAAVFADHLKRRFNNPKVDAMTEKEYYAKLSENNQVFLFGSILVAVVMALGGHFGVDEHDVAAVARGSRTSA